MSDSSMPWVKLYTEILDDTKLGRISERARWRFVQLVLMAGECDAEGYLVNGDKPMSTDDIAWRLRLEPAKCAADMASLENIGLITNTDGGWYIPKFAARQGRSQSQKREKWRENQARKRLNNSGPEWETPKTPDVLPPVIDDQSVSHRPRVEKSRGENTSAPKKPARAPDPQNNKPDPLKELAAVFEEAAGVKLEQIQKNQRGTLFWNPLSIMLKTANGQAAEYVRAAVAQLRKNGMTISDPNSVLKTFNSLKGAATTAPASPFKDYTS